MSECLSRLQVAVDRVTAGQQAAEHRRVQLHDARGSSQDVVLLGPGHRAGVLQHMACTVVQPTMGQLRQTIIGHETAHIVADQRGERSSGGIATEQPARPQVQPQILMIQDVRIQAGHHIERTGQIQQTQRGAEKVAPAGAERRFLERPH